MSQRAVYSFDLAADDLDELRRLLLHAQSYNLERARDLRSQQRAGNHARAISEADASARSAVALWALLAGVRRVTAHGEVPIGYVQRDDLARFLGIEGPMDRPGRT